MAKYYDRCWNPIFGCCGDFKGCGNCYAKSLMKRRGRQWNDFGEMNVNRKQLYRKFDETPQLIAVCTQSDLFQTKKADHEWVVDAVLAKCNMNRSNHYLFLTKFSENMKKHFNEEGFIARISRNHLEPFSFDGMAFGVSVCCKDDIHRIADLIATSNIKHRFVAFEPLLEDIEPSLSDDQLKKMEWIIIGAETGDNPTLCKQDWMIRIVERADKLGIPVFVNAVHTEEGKVTTEFDEMDERLRRSDIPFAIKKA